MKCVIIDDEPIALELLKDYISKIPFLELVASCNNGFEAMTIIQENEVDLVFTDIEMPNFSGIDIVKSHDNNRLMFIFTTGYPHYAIEGFNLNVVDFLVKPIPFHRFLKATTKAYDLFKLKTGRSSRDLSSKQQFIFVKSEYENLRIDLDEIKYIESLKDYIKIYTDREKPILTLSSLKSFEERIGTSMFIRVHKSYIVGIRYIYSVQRNRIVIGEKWIPIGLNYKEKFLKKIES